MQVKNYMEQVVKEKLEEMLKDRQDICTCEQCKLEMITHALNHLPPKYISSHKGEIYSKIDEMDTQLSADVSRCLTNAIKIVSANPRHVKQE